MCVWNSFWVRKFKPRDRLSCWCLNRLGLLELLIVWFLNVLLIGSISICLGITSNCFEMSDGYDDHIIFVLFFRLTHSMGLLDCWSPSTSYTFWFLLLQSSVFTSIFYSNHLGLNFVIKRLKIPKSANPEVVTAKRNCVTWRYSDHYDCHYD